MKRLSLILCVLLAGCVSAGERIQYNTPREQLIALYTPFLQTVAYFDAYKRDCQARIYQDTCRPVVEYMQEYVASVNTYFILAKGNVDNGDWIDAVTLAAIEAAQRKLDEKQMEIAAESVQ